MTRFPPMPRILKPLRFRRGHVVLDIHPRFVLDEVGEGLELPPLNDVAVDDRHRAWRLPYRCRPERRPDGHGLKKRKRIVGRLLTGRCLRARDTRDLGHDPISDPAVREHGATVPAVIQSREYVGIWSTTRPGPSMSGHDDDPPRLGEAGHRVSELRERPVFDRLGRIVPQEADVDLPERHTGPIRAPSSWITPIHRSASASPFGPCATMTRLSWDGSRLAHGPGRNRMTARIGWASSAGVTPTTSAGPCSGVRLIQSEPG